MYVYIKKTFLFSAKSFNASQPFWDTCTRTFPRKCAHSQSFEVTRNNNLYTPQSKNKYWNASRCIILAFHVCKQPNCTNLSRFWTWKRAFLVSSAFSRSRAFWINNICSMIVNGITGRQLKFTASELIMHLCDRIVAFCVRRLNCLFSRHAKRPWVTGVDCSLPKYHSIKHIRVNVISSTMNRQLIKAILCAFIVKYGA